MLNTLENARSVKSIKELAETVNSDLIGFETLIGFISSLNERVAYNASWTASHALEMNKQMDISHLLPQLFLVANHTAVGGIKRNIFKMLQLSKIPKDLQFDAADLAFDALKNPKEDIAVRAFALSILENIIQDLPEIIEEILFIIDKERSYASAAFQVRSKRFEKQAIKVLSKR